MSNAIAWITSWFRSKAALAAEHQRVMTEAANTTKSADQVQADLHEVNKRFESSKTYSDNIIRERDERIRDLEGEVEVLTSQLEMFTKWEARERARLEAETAMYAHRKINALESQPQDDDFL